MMEGWKTDKLMNLVSSITTGKLDANAMVPNGQYRFYTCAKEYYFIDKYAFDDEALLNMLDTFIIIKGSLMLTSVYMFLQDLKLM